VLPPIIKPAQVFASGSGGDMNDDRTGARAPNGIRACARASRTPRDDALWWAVMVRGTRDWRLELPRPPVHLTWNCITPGDRRR